MVYTVTELKKIRIRKDGGAMICDVNLPLGITEDVYPLYIYEDITISPLSYDNIISSILNTLYPSDKVQALTANYNEARDDEELSEEKRKEYMDEYHAYQAKRKEIKALAKEIMQEVTHGQV